MNSNPFLSIWFRPRETVRQLVSETPDLHVYLLAALWGIEKGFGRASQRSFGDQLSMPVIVVICIVLGSLGGLFSLWIFSHLLTFTGRWLGGTASRYDLRTAYVWSTVPNFPAFVLFAVQVMLIGQEMFTSETPILDSRPHLQNAILYMTIPIVGFAIWSWVTFSNVVAEVQGFTSAWLGLINAILAGCVLVVPVIVLALVLISIQGIR